MKPRYTLLISLLLISFSLYTQCASQKKTPPYWLLLLLNQPGQNATSNTPATTGETPGATERISLFVEHVEPNNPSGSCTTYGGLLLSFESDTKSTCKSESLTPTCFSYVLDETGFPKKLDPRSYVGFVLPVKQDLDTSFPLDEKSLFYCYDRPKPASVSEVSMYSYRDKRPGVNESTCHQTMNGNFCQDRLNLLSPVKFYLPRELALLTSDGAGNSGSHMLEIRYISETGKFVTCTYGGNFFSQTAGFTRNAYISGNVSEQYKRGQCIECTGSFCNNQINSGNGPFQIDQVYPIPTTTEIIAKDFLYLSVLNGDGSKKHAVRWPVSGFTPVEDKIDFTSLAGWIGDFSDDPIVWLFTGIILIGLFFSVIRIKRKRKSIQN